MAITRVRNGVYSPWARAINLLMIAFKSGVTLVRGSGGIGKHLTGESAGDSPNNSAGTVADGTDQRTK